MIKILIIEDQPYIRKSLISMVASYSKEIHISGECGTVSEALILVKSTKPDIVLLDINLEDGNGFDFLNNQPKIDFKIIFVTAYEEFALKAIKNGAIDYILKPIDEQELHNALDKVLDTLSPSTSTQLEIIKNHIKGKKERIVLSLQDGYQIIQLSQLLYCKSDGGYTTFYLVNGKQYMASKSLKAFEEQLPIANFIRVHQSYIINIKFAKKLDKSRKLILENDNAIPVSKRKMEYLMNVLFN